MKKWGMYEWSIILFFLAVPLLAIILEIYAFHSPESYLSIALKWFVFSGIGLRLGGAGMKQILQPRFTAKEIFNINDEKAFVVVRELGFANVCFAVIALMSVLLDSFRIPAAISGGLYFALAGFLHVFKPKDSNNEIFAMISDFYIFVILSILTVFNFLK